MLEELSEVFRKATRKQLLRNDEFMMILQCSRIHVQYLLDTNPIEFHQTGRTIRYAIEVIKTKFIVSYYK